MGKPYSAKNKKLPKQEPEPEQQNTDSGFVDTKAWINVHGKAVYVNIPEEDITIVENKKYGNRATFVTSLDSLRRLLEGEIQGVKLSKFKDE